jgi:2'-5' RNA ligase superfamily
MVHSIELLFDRDTEAALRRIWDDLASADIPSHAPAGRPHVTLVIADGIADDVDALLRPVANQLPLPCTVGAALLLGRTNAILARLIVPTAALLDLHAQVHRLSHDHLHPGPGPHIVPGQWTPHVTLARRVSAAALRGALDLAGPPPQIDGSFAGLRRWNGTTRVEYPIG